MGRFPRRPSWVSMNGSNGVVTMADARMPDQMASLRRLSGKRLCGDRSCWICTDKPGWKILPCGMQQLLVLEKSRLRRSGPVDRRPQGARPPALPHRKGQTARRRLLSRLPTRLVRLAVERVAELVQVLGSASAVPAMEVRARLRGTVRGLGRPTR